MRAFEESNFQQSEIDLISAKFESLSCLPQAQKKRKRTTEEQQTEPDTETSKRRKLDLTLSVSDRKLLEEFQEESETVFKTDEACYEHYKEMQKEQNQVALKRAEKQFFHKQLTIKKDGLFTKMVPCWASEFNLLAKVVAMQYQMVRQIAEGETLKEKLNVCQRTHPISFSWSYWDDLSQRQSSTLPSQSERNQQPSKDQRLFKESCEMLKVLDDIIVEGKKRKLMLANSNPGK